MRHRLVTGAQRTKTEPIAALLWETLSETPAGRSRDRTMISDTPRRTQRLPFDTQCAAITKSGRRCRGKIRRGTDFCLFHDPTITEEHRRQNAAKGGRAPRRLSHLPDGYLRKLTNRRAVGDAMDRLYREIRLGHLTPEMGRVLFGILVRLLDSGLCDRDTGPCGPSGRAKVDRLIPKLDAQLTYAERHAWKQAVADAPAHLVRGDIHPQPLRHHDAGVQARRPRTSANTTPAVALALTAAS